jgi:hypothetical protein
MFLVFNYFGKLPTLICSIHSLFANGVTLLEIKLSFAGTPNVLWRNYSSFDVDPHVWEGLNCSSNGTRQFFSISLPYRGLISFLTSAIGDMDTL